MRILIAEDDQVLADGLLRSLRNAGYAVDQVGSGSEADAALSSHEFDLLILDLGLPKLHGLEVLRKLRARGCQVARRLLEQRGLEERTRMFRRLGQYLLVETARRGVVAALLQRYRPFEPRADIVHVTGAGQPAGACKSSRISCANTSGLWPWLTYRRSRPCGSKMYVPVEWSTV